MGHLCPHHTIPPTPCSGDRSRKRWCLSPPPLTLAAGSCVVELGVADPLLGAESLGMPGECQPDTSHCCLCLCRLLGRAMAGDGELNRIIKDLQSKCLSPASMALAWHISPWPCRIPVSGGGISLLGVLQSIPLPTLPLLPAPILTASPRGPAAPCGSLYLLLPLLPPYHPWAGSSFTHWQKSPGLGARRGWGGRMGLGAGCQGRAMPAQPCHPSETVAKLSCSYREQNLPVTDGSRELHSLCAQLEFLLQVPLLPYPVGPSLSFPCGAAESRGDLVPAVSKLGMTPDSIVRPWASPAMRAARPG